MGELARRTRAESLPLGKWEGVPMRKAHQGVPARENFPWAN